MQNPFTRTTSAAAVFVPLLVAFAATPRSAAADDDNKYKQPASQVTVVGCVQREKDYRHAHNKGDRPGLGDEYVLINAREIRPGSSVPAAPDCSSELTTGGAYELTGGHEKTIRPFLGQFVEISGKMKKARVKASKTNSFAPHPTGGFLSAGDLKLFEIEVQSVREATIEPPVAYAPPIPAPPPVAAVEPAPAPAPEPAPEPQPTATAGRETLPKTASPMPTIGLVGLLLLAAAFTLRSCRALADRL